MPRKSGLVKLRCVAASPLSAHNGQSFCECIRWFHQQARRKAVILCATAQCLVFGRSTLCITVLKQAADWLCKTRFGLGWCSEYWLWHSYCGAVGLFFVTSQM